MRVAAALAAIWLVVTAVAPVGAGTYAWHHQSIATADTLAARIATPAGFVRPAVEPASFAGWLRGLPMKPAGSPVYLYNGLPKFWSAAHVAVVDIDVGNKDLQQCADAVMRLRAEWQYAGGNATVIAFNYTNGARVDFSRWSKGLRPLPTKSSVKWAKKGRADAGYQSFKAYLQQVFSYAGTYSLSREMAPVGVADMAIGDVFIVGGFPGHAILVVDMAEHPSTGEKRFLLAQSYMPAQDIHVLKNPGAADGSPWYPLDFGDTLVTPEWTFKAGDLKRFRH